MKKLSLILVLVIALLISSLIGTAFEIVATANPNASIIYGRETNPPADANPPTITISSLNNNTLVSGQSVVLNFNTCIGSYHGSSWIYTVYYKGDWMQDNVTIFEDKEPQLELNDILPTSQSHNSSASFSFTIRDIPEGKHNIIIYAVERGFAGDERYAVFHDFKITDSSTLNFTARQSETVIQPYVIAGVAVVAIIIAGSGVILFRHKHELSTKTTKPT